MRIHTFMMCISTLILLAACSQEYVDIAPPEIQIKPSSDNPFVTSGRVDDGVLLVGTYSESDQVIRFSDQKNSSEGVVNCSADDGASYQFSILFEPDLFVEADSIRYNNIFVSDSQHNPSGKYVCELYLLNATSVLASTSFVYDNPCDKFLQFLC
jgi:hypothetical protein